MVREFLAATDLEVDRAASMWPGRCSTAVRRSPTCRGWSTRRELTRDLRLASVHLLQRSSRHRPRHADPRAPMISTRSTPADPDPAAPSPWSRPAPDWARRFSSGTATRYRACPSEGATRLRARRSSSELELLKHLMRRFGHVSRDGSAPASAWSEHLRVSAGLGHADGVAGARAGALAAASDRAAAHRRARRSAGLAPDAAEPRRRSSSSSPFSARRRATSRSRSSAPAGSISPAGSLPHSARAGGGAFHARVRRKGRLGDCWPDPGLRGHSTGRALGAAIRGLELAAADPATD